MKLLAGIAVIAGEEVSIVPRPRSRTLCLDVRDMDVNT